MSSWYVFFGLAALIWGAGLIIRSRQARGPSRRQGTDLWSRSEADRFSRWRAMVSSWSAVPFAALNDTIAGRPANMPWLRLVEATGAQPADPRCDGVALSALDDARVAAGFGATPALYVVPGHAVNAWVVGSPQASGVGVSQGLVSALSVAELRAVFLNLLARVDAGAVRSHTQWRTTTEVNGHVIEPEQYAHDQALLVAVTADARALMLGKEPEALVSALAKTAQADARMAGVDVFDGVLLWAWPSASTHVERTEHARTEALRTIIGAAGATATLDGVQATALAEDR